MEPGWSEEAVLTMISCCDTMSVIMSESSSETLMGFTPSSLSLSRCESCRDVALMLDLERGNGREKEEREAKLVRRVFSAYC